MDRNNLNFYNAFYFALGWNTNSVMKQIDTHQFAYAYRDWAEDRHCPTVTNFYREVWNV